MKYFLLLLSALGLTACGGSDSTNSTTTAGSSSAVFNLQCDLAAVYSPVSAPVTSASTSATASKATVIVIHGKNGAPTRPFLQSLQSDLNADGYDTVMPYMPWSGLDWSGTLCEAMAYLNSLVSTEISNGNKVIVLGHSLAGPVTLAYAALADTTKPDAISIVAPGHYPHQSVILADAHADSIALAKDMINNGQENTVATFQTYNIGGAVNISATPLQYLSFHDTDEFPDIKASLPLVTLPILWVAGQSDTLTDVTRFFGINNLIPVDMSNIYKELPGDHYTVLANVSTELDNWFSGL